MVLIELTLKTMSRQYFYSSEKTPIHKTWRQKHGTYYQGSAQASRRSTYRINMPMKVAKLLLPQISNKNQETIIRIYPDKSAEAKNQTGHYMLSLSYKKLNDGSSGPPLQQNDCSPGGCCCCPESEYDR